MKLPTLFLASNDSVIPLLVFGGFCILAGVIIFVGLFQAKKRREALAKLAGSLDMSFAPGKHKPTDLGLSRMDLFAKGRSKRISNLMRGKFADTECLLFDYRYTTGSGKNSSTHNQTVVAFKIDGGDLPPFTCKPEHFFHKFMDFFGHEDINFEDHPKFSKAYRLNGENEASVRAIFNKEVIELLESQTERRWSVDGAGGWLVIHRTGLIIKPEDCSQFLLDSTTLLNALTIR